MQSCDIGVAPFSREYMVLPDTTNWMVYARKSMQTDHMDRIRDLLIRGSAMLDDGEMPGL